MLETQRRKLLETESLTEKRKGGKKQRGESFICSEKGEKRESPTKKIKWGKK